MIIKIWIYGTLKIVKCCHLVKIIMYLYSYCIVIKDSIIAITFKIIIYRPNQSYNSTPQKLFMFKKEKKNYMYIIIWPTWVWVIPKLAANGARSGNPKYWVLWKWRSNCWSCKDEYMDRGFRIFFPFPLTRVTSSPFSTTGSARSPPMKSIYNECGRIIPPHSWASPRADWPFKFY